MLHFIDIYLQTRERHNLKVIHELEHRIFLIPDLAHIYNEIQSKTNGMSYSRGIRFSLVSNNQNDITRFKKFFKNIARYELPEWTEEEKNRFELEEKEWNIRQRQYFGSFATKIWEEAFDKINHITAINLHKDILKDIFGGIRICENFQNTEIHPFIKSTWQFPVVHKKISWQENGNMIAIILPTLRAEYNFFTLASQWMETILQKHLVYIGKIYDLDIFHVYEGEYILGVFHWYQSEKYHQDMIKILNNIPSVQEFEFLKQALYFSIDEQESYHDQEANVILNFSPHTEKEIIQNTLYTDFCYFYQNCIQNISVIIKEHS